VKDPRGPRASGGRGDRPPVTGGPCPSPVSRQGGDLTVALAYPNTAAVGMGSLGYQIVRRLLSGIAGVACLRVFLPDGAKRGSLLTLDHAREVAGCDWLAFSVSYENDYPNILSIIAAAGLPLESAGRDERHPLVVIGGIAVSLNPEPLADFADVIVIGEAEEIVAGLVEKWREARDGGLDREALLLSLARLPGVYVPLFYRVAFDAAGMPLPPEPLAGVPPRVTRLWTHDLDLWRPDSDVAVEEDEAGFRDMILVEIGRGCGRGCRYCAAGSFYRPVRHRSGEAIREAVARRLPEGRRIGLLSASVFDHPDLPGLARWLAEEGCSFSVSSVRADLLDDGVLAALAAGGAKTLTIAPETGGERLRRIVGKNIPDEAFLDAAARIAAAGIPNLKLYFMLGLPGETEDDVGAIEGFVRRVRHRVLAVARGRGAMGHIGVSLSTFVPKPWTPFQWHPMEEMRTLAARQKSVVGRLKRIPNVRAVHDVPKWAHVQALLSRGDRRVGAILKAVHESGGDWARSLRDSPVNPEFFVLRHRGEGEYFPWEIVEAGVSRARLWNEYRAALEAAEAMN
jgi:radical SAM superfamily enzyme YgiQ (UPF0313 family)